MNNCIPAQTGRQRGVALLVALLVVALASVLIASLLDRGELTAARTRNQLRGAQAENYALGLEAYAAHVLSQDQANGSQIDTSSDMWALPLPPTPVPGGEIMATMSDLDGRFNLNNLSPANPQHDLWARKFSLLLAALKLDPTLAKVVQDWMGNSAIETGDAYYLAQPVPYRTSKNIFFHVSELRLLKGVSGEVYAQLAPHVSALPPGTPINVNTASVPVLMTLSSATQMTEQTAQALWQQGHASFQSLDDLKTIAPGVVVDCGVAPGPVAAVATCYDVQSSYFVARGQIMLDGLPFVFYSMIERRSGANGGNNGIRVLQRSRDADG